MKFLPLHPERKLLTGCRHAASGAIWFYGDGMTKVCYTCGDLIEDRWSEIRALTGYNCAECLSPFVDHAGLVVRAYLAMLSRRAPLPRVTEILTQEPER